MNPPIKLDKLWELIVVWPLDTAVTMNRLMPTAADGGLIVTSVLVPLVETPWILIALPKRTALKLQLKEEILTRCVENGSIEHPQVPVNGSLCVHYTEL